MSNEAVLPRMHTVPLPLPSVHGAFYNTQPERCVGLGTMGVWFSDFYGLGEAMFDVE
jgi:hypothetical protein